MKKLKILLTVSFICFVMLPISNAQSKVNVWGDIKSKISYLLSDDTNQYLFVLTNKNEIQMWNYKEANLLKTFYGPSKAHVLAVSPDGKYIACASRESVIFIWKIESGDLVTQIMTDSRLISSIIFNQKSTEIISGSYDNTVRRWDIQNGKLLHLFTAESPVNNLRYNEKTNSIICGLYNGTIKILDPTLTKTITEIKTGNYLSTLDISTNGAWLVTAGCEDAVSRALCNRSSLKLWDIKTRELIAKIEHDGKPFKSLVFDNGDQNILVANDTSYITKFAISNNRISEESKINFENKNISNLLRLNFKNTLLGVSTDGEVLFIDNISQELIKRIVEEKINYWQKKGKFEKSEDYKKRVTIDARNVKIQDFVAETINELARSKVNLNFSNSKNEYDADNEVFKIMFDGISPLYVKVPIDEARAFDDAFNQLIPKDEQYIFSADNTFALVYLKVENPQNNKEYIFDSRKDLSFFTSSLQLNFEDIDVGIIPQNLSSNVQESTKKINVGKADVDVNLPLSNVTKTDAVAVIIGNKDYKRTSNVSYAINDAQGINNYLINVLGFKEGNIIFEENASKGIFEIIFGSKENSQGKLSNYIVPDVSDVFIYYSGHGAPDLKNHRGYFVPIEADPNYIEISGYSLDVFYANIAKLKARSITIVIDACFSGANVYENISPITITMDAPELVDPRIIVMSSSSGTEVSSWFEEKNHGLFTYYFLKAIHNKNADKNGDNKLSVEEIFNYITNSSDGVNYQARRKGLEQNPTLIGDDINRTLVEW